MAKRSRVLDPPAAVGEIDRLVLESPQAAVACVPYLLGFRPERSLVLLWIARGRLVLTQRIDLPEVPGAPESTPPSPDWVTACTAPSASVGADEAIALAYLPRLPDDTGIVARALEAVERRLAERCVVLVDTLLVDPSDRWRSSGCDADCCPVLGRDVEPRVVDRIRAAFADVVADPLASRDALAAEVAVDEVARAAFTARAARARRMPMRGPQSAGERMRALQDAEEAIRVGSTTDDEETAWSLLVSLTDVGLRDALLWRIARHDDPRSLHASLIPLVRAAPAGFVAPVATCAAIAAWLAGDGARALVALDRACADDPHYTLAQLVEAALRACLPPSAWRQAMVGLSEQECLEGRDPI